MPIAGPVSPLAGAQSALRPLSLDAVTFAGTGQLAAWQRVNRDATLAHCVDQLEASGALANLRIAAGRESGTFRGFVFADSDVYKVLEAIGWEAGRAGGGAEAFAGFVDETVALLEAAQQDDGYLDSFFQVAKPDEQFADLRWGHEMYCLGHLLQAGVAWARTSARTDLLEVGLRFAELVEARFGAGGVDAVCGHPEIETALVEVYRVTGQRRWLDLAQRFIDLRGHRTVGEDRFGYGYFQDHEPVRSVPGATGHSVRQLYLAAGVADAYAENGDTELLAALERIWHDVHQSKMYVTGGLGARHRDEAFGDPFELPPDRAYSETCAAISSVQFNWRMLLITGEGRFADELERALYNAVAGSTTSDGTAFFYSNPLQVRTHRDGAHEQAPARRVGWYDCACCPPNLARLVSSLQHYAATTAGGSLQLHLYETGSIDLGGVGGAATTARITTGYPVDGTVLIQFDHAFTGGEVALRVPGWAESWRVTVNGEPVDLPVSDGYARVAGAGIRSIELVLEMPVRLRRAHPQVDAVRGCVVVTRGPLVYALEQADLPEGLVLEDFVIDTAVDAELGPVDAVLGVPLVRITGARRAMGSGELYPVLVGAAAGAAPPADSAVRSAAAVPIGGEPVVVTAVPYYRWGNRAPGGMRVWIPTS
ncbi:glycoside hydrolase family 127 protein [Cryobacterium sp. SO2]|uniref:glycoside hydrolase family 127 protein n=1 Tax=Cryobacterium sp. SO2 TaxID=1897060 RepID=UPI00223D590F|nr:beta-L-arabinofuranosidase domain-containing protein [Cryobacterium sp. SO2]WEO77886.1 glycoside hydrolase family 127 protein [Cryobacterium sp. SO2]